MSAYCSFRSPQDACHAIGHVADVDVGKLVCRPWNMHAPERSPWWLVPSGDWPAYRYGKYYFDWILGDETRILCGLYIEKGLGEAVRDAYSGAKWARSIMTPNWTWHRWLQDLQTHRVSDVVKNVARISVVPVEFRIDGSHVSGPDFDRSETTPKYPTDVYHLRWKPNATEFEFVGADRKANVLDELSEAMSFADLYRVLEGLGRNPWLWIDVFVALQLEIKQGGVIPVESEHSWGAERIWGKFLRHFLPWVTP